MLAIVCLAAACWAVAGSQWILPHLSANSDEGIYLLQADGLQSGLLAPSAPEVEPEAFVPWFATLDGDRYILKYTPVHASLLAAATAIGGSARLGLGVIAVAIVLAVAGLARELGHSRRAVVVAAALFAASPLTLQQMITFLPYGTSLAFGIGSMALGLRAARCGSWPLALAAGTVWGMGFFARPYDAVLFGAAALLGISARGQWRNRLRTLAAAAAGAAAPVVALLVFNHLLTGDSFQLPFNLLEPADRIGFGARRSLPTDPFLDFGPREGARALGRNLLLVVAWTGGGLVATFLALRGLRKAGRRLGALVALIVVWCAGYAVFWGSYLSAFIWDGALFLGPYYFFPLVAVISIAAAPGIVELWEREAKMGAAVTVAMLVLSAAVVVPALADQNDRSSGRRELVHALEDTIDGPALVFVPPLYGPYLQNPFSFLRNRAELERGDVVYALSRADGADATVMAAFPDRAVYRLDLLTGWSDQPGFDPEIEIVRLR